MPKLFEIPDDVEDVVAEDELTTYGESFAFDFETGDFEIVGGKPVEADGHRAWVDWCIKAALTTRYAWLIYDEEYGVDWTTITESSARAEGETLIEAEITDALEADDRTAQVSEFAFEWKGDGVIVSFTIEPTIGTTEEVRLPLQPVS